MFHFVFDTLDKIEDELKQVKGFLIGIEKSNNGLSNKDFDFKKKNVIKFKEYFNLGRKTSTTKNEGVDDVRKKPSKGSIRWDDKKSLWRGRFQYKNKSYEVTSKKYNICYEKHEYLIKKAELENIEQIEMQNKKYNYTKNTILKEWYDYWFNKYKKPFLRETSLYTYTSLYNAYLKNTEVFKEKLYKITTFRLQEVIDEIVAYHSKSKVKEILNACFEKAIDTGILTFNPVRAVILPPNKKETIRKTLTQNEVNKILSYCKNSGINTDVDVYLELHDLYFLMFHSGIRIGEALALKWSDIDFESKTIIINKTFVERTKKISEPKTKNSIRTIPLFKDLENLLINKPKNNEFLFSLLQQKQTRDYAKMIENRVGVNFNNHMFRHTFASNCLAKGINPKTIQKWLGHSKLDMTMNTYVDVIHELENSDIDKYNKD